MAEILKPDEIAILAKPMVQWDAHCSQPGWDALRLTDLSGNLMNLCAHVARSYGYTNARSHGHDHSASVKESNNVAARVRKALGYTYPKSDLMF